MTTYRPLYYHKKFDLNSNLCGHTDSRSDIFFFDITTISSTWSLNNITIKKQLSATTAFYKCDLLFFLGRGKHSARDDFFINFFFGCLSAPSCRTPMKETWAGFAPIDKILTVEYLLLYLFFFCSPREKEQNCCLLSGRIL